METRQFFVKVLRTKGSLVGVCIPLLVIWIGLSFASPYFLTPINIKNILLQSSILGVLATGMTIALIAEEIDLSIGAVEGLCAVVSAILCIELGLPWPLAALGAIACGLVVGIFNGWVTTRLGIPSFITTLASLGISSGIALRITEGNSISGFPEAYTWLGRGSFWGIPAPAIVFAASLFVAWFFLEQTKVGLRLYATGGNQSAAAELGLSPKNLKLLALAISGLCGGISGILISARLNSANANLGQFDLLDAIAAVVIGGVSLTGGVGSVLGTLFGVLIMVTIRNGLDLLGVSPFWQTAAVGAMILAAAILHKFSTDFSKS
jgi:ribose/xylose/arabinose/galactoside ABC-type transport system permease subunit